MHSQLASPFSHSLNNLLHDFSMSDKNIKKKVLTNALQNNITIEHNNVISLQNNPK